MATLRAAEDLYAAGYHEHARHHLVDVLPKVAVTLGTSSRVTVTVQELIADCQRKTGKYHLAAVGQRTVCKALTESLGSRHELVLAAHRMLENDERHCERLRAS
jgi:hypothetical protein